MQITGFLSGLNLSVVHQLGFYIKHAEIRHLFRLKPVWAKIFAEGQLKNGTVNTNKC